MFYGIFSGMDGIKTGYIRASGFNLVASAVRGKSRIIGVVFGGRSAVARDNQMAQLLDQSFASMTQMPPAAQMSPANMEAQGDATDTNGDTNYITLPAKVPAVFVHTYDQAAINQAVSSYSR